MRNGETADAVAAIDFVAVIIAVIYFTGIGHKMFKPRQHEVNTINKTPLYPDGGRRRRIGQ